MLTHTHTGGVAYILMFNHLLQTASFPWAIRAMGFVALACALFSIPALLSGSSMIKPPSQRRALFDKTALHDRLFLIFTICTFATYLGYMVPYFYIPTYARERLGTSESAALYMLVIAISGSFFGRLGSGLAAHLFGPIVTWVGCATCSGVLALSWMAIEDIKGFRAFSVLYGMFFFLSFLSLFISSWPRSPPPPTTTSSPCILTKHP